MPSEAATQPDLEHALPAWQFNAFISYSHAADGKLAPAVELGLKRFAKPLLRLRALEVFRDDAALSADPGLWRAIEAALDASRNLILMASPEAAASPWVAREVTHWLKTKPATTIFIVQTEGEVCWDESGADFDWERTTALPAILRGRLGEEPRWIDLRWARSDTDLSLTNPRFREAIADLAAPLHGRRKDELIGDDVAQHRRLRRLTRSAVAALVSLVMALGVALFYALAQRQEARAQTVLAERQRDDALRTQSLFLADLSAQRLRSGDAVTAALLALRALPQDGDRPYVAQAEAALRRAALSRRELALIDGRSADTDSAHSVVVSHDAGLIGAAVGKRAVLWDATTHELALTLEGHADHINALRFSPDDSLIATASHDGTLRLWQRATGAARHTLDAHGGPVWCAAFSPDGKLIASGTGDGKIRLWDVASGALLQVLQGHGHWVRAVEFLPDGRRLVSASNDGTIRIWNVDGGSAESTLEASKEWLLALAVSPNGAVVASGGADSTIRFWGVRDGRLRGTLSGHSDGVASVAFSRDGRRLVSGA
jgi:hypothetical protein